MLIETHEIASTTGYISAYDPIVNMLKNNFFSTDEITPHTTGVIIQLYDPSQSKLAFIV